MARFTLLMRCVFLLAASRGGRARAGAARSLRGRTQSAAGARDGAARVEAQNGAPRRVGVAAAGRVLRGEDAKAGSSSIMRARCAHTRVQIDTLESKLATARAEAAYAASSSSSTQPPSSPPQPHASKAAPKFEVHVPSFAPAPPPPPPPRAAVPSARRAPPSSSSSSSSGGGPTCPKCKSQFASFETFYGHEPCPGARAGLLSEISEGACLRKAPAPVSKPNVVEKKPGAFANFAEVRSIDR